MAAPDLAELRTRVRERINLSPKDARFPDDVVSRRINMAYGDVVDGVQPNGWWWQHFEVTKQNVTGGDVAQWPVVLETPDNARSIRKVYAVFGSLDGNYWLRIDERERTDQVRLAGGRRVSDGLPQSWSALPSPTVVAGTRRQIVVVFDPPLPNLAYVRMMVVATMGDLEADGDEPVGIPPMIAELVVEGAAMSLLRQRRDANPKAQRANRARLVAAQAAYDDWMRAARIYFNAPAAGPGYMTPRDLGGM